MKFAVNRREKACPGRGAAPWRVEDARKRAYGAAPQIRDRYELRTLERSRVLQRTTRSARAAPRPGHQPYSSFSVVKYNG